MTAWWHLFRKAFTAEECEEITKYALNLPAVEGSVGHGGKNHINKGLRNSTVRWIQRWEDPWTRWIFDRVALLTLEANQAFGLELSDYPKLNFPSFQFTEYDSKEEQHYDWHEDMTWLSKTPVERKVSVVIQLTDPSKYEGGKLETERDNPAEGVFRDQGDLILFPSHLRHRVTPVTKGTRHSLVTWINGPRLR